MKNVLIVENSTIIPNILKDFFSKKKDFKIFVAKSYEEAKDILEKKKIFAAISNIVLPDALNGELLKLLNEKNIPTVVLTSKLDKDTLKIIRSANVADYISKDSMYELQSSFHLIDLLTYTEYSEILIVDDSEVITAKLKDSLETLLLNVHVAKSGLQALNVLEKFPSISLIITDYNMEGLDGLELIKRVRKNEKFTDIPILIMTIDSCDELKSKFYKNGATDFLTKPILDEELKSKIINIFSKKKQVDEIKMYNKTIDDNVITSSTDKAGIINYVSKAFCEISGYEKDELIGKTHGLLRHPEMPDSLYKELWANIKNGKEWRGEIKNLRKDGTFYWVQVVIEPLFDRKNNIIGYNSVRQDITDRKRIYELSITDGLTGLFNRRYFNEVAQEVLEDSIRDNEVFGFLILDVDNFKKYNDTYGHQMGDDVLIAISKSLKDSFKRENDKIFRLGGEEFGALISAKSIDDIISLVNEAKDSIRNLEIKHEKNPPSNFVTASFGLVILSLNKNELILDDIYKLGDDKLYEAKNNGRDRVEYTEI